MNQLDTEVLVIGGGFTGIMLLDKLIKKGYRTVLVTEKEIGDGQSLRMHGYMHNATMSKNSQTQSLFIEGVTQWKEVLDQLSVGRTCDRLVISFPQAISEGFVSCWTSTGLPFSKIDAPSELSGLAVSDQASYFDIHGDVMFDNLELMQKLAAPVKEYVIQGAVSSMKSADNHINEVQVTLPNGNKLTISAKYIIAASGSGTRSLLETIQATEENQAKYKQQLENLVYCKNVHMICLKAKPGTLPPFSYFAINNQLAYIVHQLKGGEGQNFELAYLTPFYPEAAQENYDSHPNIEAPVHSESVKKSILAFKQMFPNLRLEDIEFTVYAGWKQHGKDMNPQVGEFAGIDNLCLCLPFAIGTIPIVTNQAVEHCVKKIVPSNEKDGVLAEIAKVQKEATQVGDFGFNKCKWVNWEQFKSTYQI